LLGELLAQFRGQGPFGVIVGFRDCDESRAATLGESFWIHCFRRPQSHAEEKHGQGSCGCDEWKRNPYGCSKYAPNPGSTAAAQRPCLSLFPADRLRYQRGAAANAGCHSCDVILSTVITTVGTGHANGARALLGSD